MTDLYNRSGDRLKRKLLRSKATFFEKVLWKKLRLKQMDGFRFRRQFSVDAFVVDFYCPELRLAVEVDGDYHLDPDTQNYDEVRSLYLESLGITVLRFTNESIEKELDLVLIKIREFLR